MFGYILLAIGIILLYKLIFDFIVPIYRTTKDLKQKFREMHRQAGGYDESAFGQKEQSRTTIRQAKESKPAKKDYIDFEEIN